MALELPETWAQVTERALSWLARFAEHEPDFADGFLVAWAEADPSLEVWTFDREFSTVWRTLSGKQLKLVSQQKRQSA